MFSPLLASFDADNASHLNPILHATILCICELSFQHILDLFRLRFSSTIQVFFLKNTSDAVLNLLIVGLVVWSFLDIEFMNAHDMDSMSTLFANIYNGITIFQSLQNGIHKRLV